MATVSLRHMVGCAEHGATYTGKVQGTLSVLHDFLMYTTVPRAEAGKVDEVSIARQVRRLREGPYINVNFIYVGLDLLNNPSSVDRHIDRALALARRAFGEVGIGIGRAARGDLPDAEAEDFGEIGSKGEGRDLFACVSFEENDGIDVFVVRSYSGDDVEKGGMSPVDGSCDQDGKESGVLVNFEASLGMGVVLAHELGHYLGLCHLDAEDNVNEVFNMMYEGGKTADASFWSFQGETMREHCMMRPPCS